MNRDDYLKKAIALYLQAPDTPSRAHRADWAVAITFFQRGVDLEDLAHAIRLTAMRRHCRESDLPALEPICSLAYFRPLLELLRQEPHDPGYVEHVRWRFQQAFGEMEKKRGSPAKSGGL